MNQEQKEERPIKTFVIDLGKIRQTRAFARQDGAILGVVWIISFVCTMVAVSPEKQFFGLLSNLLLISTPFVVAKRLKSFRDYVLEGTISFKRGFYYCLQTFFNATLLLTIVQYLWFRFMDTGLFMSQLQANYEVVMQAYQLTKAQAAEVMKAITMMKPIAWASMFMIVDLIVGCLLSPIIAALMARKINNNNISNQTAQ